MSHLTKEQFEEWRENPATVSVLRALKNYSHLSREQWQAQAWGANFLSPEEQASLSNLKGRSRLAEELSQLDFETYEHFASEMKERA